MIEKYQMSNHACVPMTDRHTGRQADRQREDATAAAAVVFGNPLPKSSYCARCAVGLYLCTLAS